MKAAIIIITIFISLSVRAQLNQPWHGKKCAVVLTYDDGYDQQLDNAVPVLDSLGLKATFYISAFFSAVKDRIDEWKRLALEGNELGNHTLYHPCIGGPDRTWVRPEYDLRNYSAARMVDEIRMENVYLRSVDGKTKRTFAFPCADTKAGGIDFSNAIKNDFAALRSVRNEMHKINEIDLNNVDCYMVNGETGEQLIAWAKQAMETNSLLVILFHGVGGGNALNVELTEHKKFLEFLKQNEKDIMIAPMIDVAEHIRTWQANDKTKEIQQQAAQLDTKGLKDYYKNYFPIGVAVSPRALKTDEVQLVLEQFNSMTPENSMKMGPIHPKENEYNWADADSIAAFARRNHLKLRGHCLCWHNQTPNWLFKDAEGKTVSKEVLLQRLKDHITAVVTRYKDVVYAWDVVNEAISDKPDEFYRPSEFYKICGKDFIAKAFEYAHAADPNAILFYNDYNEISAVKRSKIIKMVTDLKKTGVPIHAVGLQGHWANNEPSEAQLDSTLSDFSKLGLKLQITELDISVYPKEHNARERQASDYDTAFSAEKEAKQMEVYNMCFKLFRKYKKSLSGVTFWNISDRHSWLDDFPVRGRKDYPLLFDKNLQPKKAFWEVVKF